MSTISRYATWLKKLQPDGLDIEALEDNTDALITQTLNLKADQQTMAVIIKILTLFKANDTAIKAWEKAYNKIRYKPATSANRPATDKEKEKEITYDDLLAKRDEINAKWEQLPDQKKDNQSTLSLAIQRLVLTLYTELPPLRGENYFNATYDVDSTGNRVVLSEPAVLVVVEGKKMKNKEPLEIELNETIVNAMVDARKLSKASPWLIPQIKDTSKHMNTSGFTRFLNRMFGRNVSTSTLRNVVVSHYIDEGYTKEQLDDIARIMNHTPATQRSIYSKYSKKYHPETNGDTNEVKKLKEQVKKLQKDSDELQRRLGDMIQRNNQLVHDNDTYLYLIEKLQPKR
jgi:hypothetical protein